MRSSLRQENRWSGLLALDSQLQLLASPLALRDVLNHRTPGTCPILYYRRSIFTVLPKSLLPGKLQESVLR